MLLVIIDSIVCDRSLEKLGMRNLNGFTGTGMSPLFQDAERAANMKSITFSGTKNVIITRIKLVVKNSQSAQTSLLCPKNNLLSVYNSL